MNKDISSTTLISIGLALQIIAIVLSILWTQLPGARPYDNNPEYIFLLLAISSMFAAGLFYASLKAGASKLHAVPLLLLAIILTVGGLVGMLFITGLNEWAKQA
jgi:hypothetical protein